MTTALDLVVPPLSRDESDLLVMLAGPRRQRLGAEYDPLLSALAQRSRGGLVYYMGQGHWALTVFGRDVATEIKAAAGGAPPPAEGLTPIRELTAAADKLEMLALLFRRYAAAGERDKGPTLSRGGLDSPVNVRIPGFTKVIDLARLINGWGQQP